jgi:AcrR family transcriptional regulator
MISQRGALPANGALRNALDGAKRVFVVGAKVMSSRTVSETRVDPRVTRTQKLIRDALSALLSEKPFESISVQDIAERATVNRATFYAHFQDKFELLDTLIREALREHLVEGDPLEGADTRLILQAVGTNLLAFVAMNGNARVDRDFEPQFERAMEAELTEFLAPKFSDCAALLISSAMVGVAMQWRSKGRETPADATVRELVDVLSSGVAKFVR